MNKPGLKIKYITRSGNVHQTRFWDKRELALYLKLSIYTIDAWVSEKRIPYIKLGGKKVVFDKDEIEKWIDQQKVEPAGAEKLDRMLVT